MENGILRFAIPLTFLLVGCGGGGSGGSSGVANAGSGNTSASDSYQGQTTPAILSSSNAIEFSNRIFQTTFEPASGSFFKPLQQSDPDVAPQLVDQLESVQDFVAKVAVQAFSDPEVVGPVIAQAVDVDDSIDCPEGGTISITGVLSDDLLGNLEMDFSNCSNLGISVDGTVLIEISESNVDYAEIEIATFDYQRVLVSAGSFSSELSGTVTVDAPSSINQITTTYNFFISSNFEEDTLLENLVNVVSKETNSAELVSAWSGRIYLESEGYVLVSTEADLVFTLQAGEETLDSGTVVFEGAGSSTLRIEAINQELYLQVDEDGDGIYELGSLQDLSPGTGSPGNTPVAVVTKLGGFEGFAQAPSIISLSARESFDSDGGFLSYRWSVMEAPNGDTDGILGNTTGTEVQATLDVSGTYVFSLIIENESGAQSATDYILFAPELVPFSVTPDWSNTSFNEIEALLGFTGEGNLLACLKARSVYSTDGSLYCEAAAKLSPELDLLDTLSVSHRPEYYNPDTIAFDGENTIVAVGQDYGGPSSNISYYDGIIVVDSDDFSTSSTYDIDDSFYADIPYFRGGKSFLINDYFFVLYQESGSSPENYQLLALDIHSGVRDVIDPDLRNAATNQDNLYYLSPDFLLDPNSDAFYIWDTAEDEIFILKYEYVDGELVEHGHTSIFTDEENCQYLNDLALVNHGNWFSDNCGRIFSIDSSSFGLTEEFQIELGTSSRSATGRLPEARFLLDDAENNQGWFSIAEEVLYDGVNSQTEYRVVSYHWGTQHKLMDSEMPNIEEYSDLSELRFDPEGTPIYPQFGKISPDGGIYLVTRYGSRTSLVMKIE